MRALLAVLTTLLLSSFSATAQYAHISNPGVIGNAKPTLTTNGQCVFVGAGGSNSAMFAVTGTWTGTLGFFGSNDNGATTIALQAYSITPGTGALNASTVNTTTGNGVWIADTFGMNQVEVCATAAMTGTAVLQLDAMPADVVQQITGVGGAPVAVTGSLSVSGTADLVSAGAPTTFNANAVCTGSLLLAGEQTAGFELNAGTLTATLTPQCSMEASGANFVNGQFKDATGAATNTLAVTSANPQTALQIMCPGGARRAQVCTTAFTSGTATGLANATFFQGASAAGGGGSGAVTQSTAGTLGQSWFTQITDATTGPVAVKAASTLPAATDKALTVTIRDALPGTQTVQALGTANSPSGGVFTCQPPSGSTIPFAIYTPGATNIAANEADNLSTATTLTAACTSTTGCGVTSSIQWPMNGNQGATVTLTTSVSAVGIVPTCDPSWDGGTTYLLGGCDMWQLHGAYRKGALTNADVVLAATSPQQWIVYAPGSPSHIRLRLATFTSGSVTVAGRGTMAPALPTPIYAKPQTPGNSLTLTASTAETTLVAAGGAGVFLDLLDVACSNTSTSSNVITLRDTTGGTARKPIVCPAQIGPCEGFTFPSGLQQTAANTNWTVQAASLTTSVICSATAVQR